jgi:hypothetical protein
MVIYQSTSRLRLGDLILPWQHIILEHMGRVYTCPEPWHGQGQLADWVSLISHPPIRPLAAFNRVVHSNLYQLTCSESAVSPVRKEYMRCSCPRISGRITSHALTPTHLEAHNSEHDIARQAARAPNWRSHHQLPFRVLGSGHVGRFLHVTAILHDLCMLQQFYMTFNLCTLQLF